MDDLEPLLSPLSLGMWTGLHEMYVMCWVQASQRASLPRGQLLLPHYWKTDGRSLSMCSKVGSSSHHLHKREFHLSEYSSSLESSLVLTRSVMISYHFSLQIQGLYLWFSILSLRPILCHLCVAKSHRAPGSSRQDQVAAFKFRCQSCWMFRLPSILVWSRCLYKTSSFRELF